MANTRISDLAAGAAVSGTDLFPDVQTVGVGPVKVTAAQIKTYTSASPTLVTPTLGVASATSINKMAITAPATGSTLAVADGKTLTASNTLTLAGTDSTTMTFPPASASIGYINIPQNSQTTNYTTVLADSGKHIIMNGSSLTFTIDSNANVPFAVGTVITIVNANASNLSIAITSDTLTFAGTTTTGTRTLGQNGIATAIKTASTSWLISGVGIS